MPPRIHEPSPIQDVFVTGILEPERYGEYVRITHVLDRPDPESGEIVRVVVSRVIYPLTGFLLAVNAAESTIRCHTCPILQQVRHALLSS
jgi:hypothetical protein